jgi:ribosomal protein L19E
MSGAAKVDALEALHVQLAEHMTDVLKNGEKTVDREGNEIRVPPAAATLNAIRQFLKDNDVKAAPSEGSAMDRLGKAAGNIDLPFEGDYPQTH